MKKIIVLGAIVAMMCSCNGNKSVQPKDNGMKKAEATEIGATGKIAYVEIDSLMTQLEMCKEAKARLEAQGNSYRKELDAKSATFQKAYRDFAQKMQSTGYASQDEYEAAQKKLAKMQEDGTKLEQKYAEKLAADQEAFNAVLRDSVQAYIAVLNADHRYSMILSKSGDNVLYADPSLDITSEVVKGMNKRYKKSK